MANERPTGIQERMLYSLEMIETYLGILAGKAHTEAGGTRPTPTKPMTAGTGVGATAAPEQTAEPTVDDMRAVLKDCAENFGRETAIKFLKDKGYKNAGAVPAAERAGFIAYVESGGK